MESNDGLMQSHPDEQLQQSENNISSGRTISRRRLLGLGLAAGAVGIGAAVLGPRAWSSIKNEERKSEFVDNNLLELGEPERISFEDYGMRWLPDGHIPFITFSDGEKIGFISSNAKSYAVKIEGDKMMPNDLAGNFALSCIGPEGNEKYRNGYTSITNVFQLNENNPEELTAIIHNEQWASPGNGAGYTGSIGIAESNDRGRTWSNIKQAISASDALEPGGKVTGVGQPCAFVREQNGQKFLQVLYLYLPENGAYLIHTSRAPIENGKIGKFRHWTGKDFEDVEIHPDNVKPVILPPQSVGESYSALPAVAKHRDKLVCVYETQKGFCAATSKDGVVWDGGQMVLEFPHGQYPHFEGQRWYSNPTLWSLDKDNDQEISDEGYLIYSSGKWPEPHQMERRKFRIK